MIAELGHYALMLALGLALIQATMPVIGTRTNDPVLMSMAAPTALAHFAFVAMAFTALATRHRSPENPARVLLQLEG
jgi:cytochrome c-type biogenesis protein CcmF